MRLHNFNVRVPERGNLGTRLVTLSNKVYTILFHSKHVFGMEWDSEVETTCANGSSEGLESGGSDQKARTREKGSKAEAPFCCTGSLWGAKWSEKEFGWAHQTASEKESCEGGCQGLIDGAEEEEEREAKGGRS